MRDRPGETGAGRCGPSVVTIGNLDGIHLGHQALIRRCRGRATAGERIAVITFEPLPQAWFRPDQPPARLTTTHQKLAQLERAGVDVCWMMRFDEQLARLPAAAFARSALAETLGATAVVVGEDFRFGYKREGDVSLLTELGGSLGFDVVVEPPVRGELGRISSTGIRAALADGDFMAAAAMLGRPFRMEGHVVAGEKLGRDLGYPTANLRIRARPAPVEGIFAVFARVCDGAAAGGWREGVSSLGRRPTVDGTEPLLEVHLFDFSGDLYGRRLEVEFVAKLRDESRFETIDAMVEQMRADAAGARAVLQGREPGRWAGNETGD